MYRRFKVEDRELLNEYIPSDHSLQVTSKYFTDILFMRCSNIRYVMDLGCGKGDSLDYFRAKNPDVSWIGLDIEKSPEVELRERTDAEFYSFDGIHIPFEDNSFDLVYCNQVFEHVRYPAKLLKEIYRVMKPSSYFVGSTSHLEPYHSFSYWNFTPYGFCNLVEAAGLQLEELRPSVDALTLIVRRFLGRPKFFSRWFEKESLPNRVISLIGKIRGKQNSRINAEKLLVCGHFCFLVRKMD